MIVMVGIIRFFWPVLASFFYLKVFFYFLGLTLRGENGIFVSMHSNIEYNEFYWWWPVGETGR
jgi:hypothetical protein